jgi:hypothetical protein
MNAAKLGRPCLPAEDRRECRKSVYLPEPVADRFRRLARVSGFPSESAFLAHCLRLGVEVFEARERAGAEILAAAKRQ